VFRAKALDIGADDVLSSRSFFTFSVHIFLGVATLIPPRAAAAGGTAHRSRCDGFFASLLPDGKAANYRLLIGVDNPSHLIP